MTAENLVFIGRVVKPHGLKGEVCMKSYADSPFVLDGLTRLYLAPPGGTPSPRELASWRMHREVPLVRFANVPDRTAAEALRGQEIYAHADDLPEAEEDEFFLHEIEGARILLPDGTELGRLEGFLDAPQEVWIIRAGTGEEVLFTPTEQTVLDVDLDEERGEGEDSPGTTITIDPPEGLLELYLTRKEG
jgi:16S rRNA processing protein RimM